MKRSANRLGKRLAPRPVSLAVERFAERAADRDKKPTPSDVGEPRPGPSRPGLAVPIPTFHQDSDQENFRTATALFRESAVRDDARASRQPSRLSVRSVACVECGAEPGQPCIGLRRPRKSNHATRVESYLAWAEMRERSAA